MAQHSAWLPRLRLPVSRTTGPALLAPLLGAAVGAAWLAAGPRTPDLAAQLYRVQLFVDHGLILYDPQWYQGHLLPAYSVLFPPLGALIGTKILGALATGVSIVAFDRLAHGHFGERACRATLWFALVAGMNLVSARLTFALGLALGLSSLLAFRESRNALGAVLAVSTTLASPLAGLFLAGSGGAWALANRSLRPLVLGGAALVTLATLEIAFPEGGTFGFPGPELWRLLAMLAAVAVLLPRSERVIRAGLLVYACVAVAVYLAGSPVGANIARLALLTAGPLLAGALGGRRALVLVALAPIFVLWSWKPTAHDLQGAEDPSVSAAYYAPLEGFLSKHDSPPTRTEIPFTRGHWETAYIARRYMLARGWERQLDRTDNAVFYPLTPKELGAADYLRWLHARAVRYVALPDAALDHSAYRERTLIFRRPGYLREVWHSRHWRVFEVRAFTPLLDGPGRLLSVTGDSFELLANRPGRFLVRLHFSAYWHLPRGSGCVRRSALGWTELRISRPGRHHVSSRFSLAPLLGLGPDCRV